MPILKPTEVYLSTGFIALVGSNYLEQLEGDKIDYKEIRKNPTKTRKVITCVQELLPQKAQLNKDYSKIEQHLFIFQEFLKNEQEKKKYKDLRKGFHSLPKGVLSIVIQYLYYKQQGEALVILGATCYCTMFTGRWRASMSLYKGFYANFDKESKKEKEQIWQKQLNKQCTWGTSVNW